MAVPNTWEYVVPQLADDEAEHLRAARVRVVTYLRRGLFADAMQHIMEQERFEVVAAHSPDSVLELARTADGCIVDQPFQPRLPEGMIRCYMGVDKVGFGHQLIKALIPPPPEGPNSPAAQPGPRIMHGPDAKPFKGSGPKWKPSGRRR